MTSQTRSTDDRFTHGHGAARVVGGRRSCGGISAFYYFAELPTCWCACCCCWPGLASPRRWRIAPSTGRTGWGYIRGARIELRKIIWPTRQESVQTTLMIAVVVLITALLLWGLDSTLAMGR